MTTVSIGFAPWVFSVVRRSYTARYYVFGHELGHMGAHHDWLASRRVRPYATYNHGYVNAAKRFRTVMAYNDECSANGIA